MATNTSLNTGTVPIPVASGGTGDASLTAYAVLCGGTTSTGAVQSIASVGTTGYVLTSNGAAALPTFQAAGGGGSGGLLSVQVFTTSGTWNRPVGVGKIIIELQGAGGGGGGYSSFANEASGSGGGAGAYGQRFLDVSAISSASVTIGAGGAAAVTTANGTAGGTTSFGSYISSTGGGAGQANTLIPVAGGVCTSGTVNGVGARGEGGTSVNAEGGGGGNSTYGMGASRANVSLSASGYGAGGGGGTFLGSTHASATAGTQGIVIVWEYS